MLRQANLEVHAVSSIESGRQMLKVSHPDLVLLDCLSHGANDFVVKPVQKNALITKVRGFVGH